MSQTSKTKRVLYGLLAAIGVTAGAAGIAAAATNQSSPSNTATTTAEQGDGNHDDAPSYTSSIVDKASANEADGAEEDDAAEAARLEKLATVTPDEAKAAALAAQPGTADKVELESENGNVVYGVEVTTFAVEGGNGAAVSPTDTDVT